MKFRGLAAVVTIGVFMVLSAGVAPASAGTIVYSPTYQQYLQLFPSGWALNYCDFTVTTTRALNSFCQDTITPYYFYPDGTHGYDSWIVDSSSPVGWSLYRPCEGVPPFEEELWYAYVDGTNYLQWGIGDGSIEVPPLTDAQVECGIWLYGWWF